MGDIVQIAEVRAEMEWVSLEALEQAVEALRAYGVPGDADVLLNDRGPLYLQARFTTHDGSGGGATMITAEGRR